MASSFTRWEQTRKVPFDKLRDVHEIERRLEKLRISGLHRASDSSEDDNDDRNDDTSDESRSQFRHHLFNDDSTPYNSSRRRRSSRYAEATRGESRQDDSARRGGGGISGCVYPMSDLYDDTPVIEQQQEESHSSRHAELSSKFPKAVEAELERLRLANQAKNASRANRTRRLKIQKQEQRMRDTSLLDEEDSDEEPKRGWFQKLRCRSQKEDLASNAYLGIQPSVVGPSSKQRREGVWVPMVSAHQKHTTPNSIPAEQLTDRNRSHLSNTGQFSRQRSRSEHQKQNTPKRVPAEQLTDRNRSHLSNTGQFSHQRSKTEQSSRTSKTRSSSERSFQASDTRQASRQTPHQSQDQAIAEEAQITVQNIRSKVRGHTAAQNEEEKKQPNVSCLSPPTDKKASKIPSLTDSFARARAADQTVIPAPVVSKRSRSRKRASEPRSKLQMPRERSYNDTRFDSPLKTPSMRRSASKPTYNLQPRSMQIPHSHTATSLTAQTPRGRRGTPRRSRTMNEESLLGRSMSTGRVIPHSRTSTSFVPLTPRGRYGSPRRSTPSERTINEESLLGRSRSTGRGRGWMGGNRVGSSSRPYQVQSYREMSTTSRYELSPIRRAKSRHEQAVPTVVKTRYPPPQMRSFAQQDANEPRIYGRRGVATSFSKDSGQSLTAESMAPSYIW